jgi:hypothetical protein
VNPLNLNQAAILADLESQLGALHIQRRSASVPLVDPTIPLDQLSAVIQARDAPTLKPPSPEDNDEEDLAGRRCSTMSNGLKDPTDTGFSRAAVPKERVVHLYLAHFEQQRANPAQVRDLDLGSLVPHTVRTGELI